MALSVHSPDRIVQTLLIDRGLGTEPLTSPQGAWPVWYEADPDTPDSVIVVKDKDSPGYWRLQPTGEAIGYPGIVVTVRSANKDLAFEKAQTINDWMATEVYDFGVTLDGVSYLIHCFARIGSAISQGKDKNNTRRSLVAFDCVVSYKVIGG